MLNLPLDCCRGCLWCVWLDGTIWGCNLWEGDSQQHHVRVPQPDINNYLFAAWLAVLVLQHMSA